MPDPFENALAYYANRQQMQQAEAMRAALAAQAYQRQLQLQALRNFYINQRAQPRLQLLQQQATARQQAAATKQAQDDAIIQWVMSLNPKSVEPQWRPFLTGIQESLKQSPSAAVAKIFASKYRPGGLQFKSVETTDPATGAPITKTFVFDPMAGGVPSLAPSASPAALSGGTPTPPSVSALRTKYGLTGGP